MGSGVGGGERRRERGDSVSERQSHRERSSSAEPSSVVARKDDGSKSETEKTSNPKAETFNPGSDFWTWTPPEVPAADKAPGEPTPKLQKQTQTRVSAAVAIAERPLEQALHLKFQSDTETRANYRWISRAMRRLRTRRLQRPGR